MAVTTSPLDIEACRHAFQIILRIPPLHSHSQVLQIAPQALRIT